MNAWAALAASSLLSAVWQGLVLTAMVALVLRTAPGISAAVRSTLWGAVFLCAIALHFIPASPAPAAHHANPAWSVAVAALWLLLSLYRAGQLAVGAWQLHALARRATPMRHDLPAGRFRRAALLCTSTEVDRPSVIGFLAPRILIPAALYTSLTPAELKPILLHETGHLRRGDDWTNLLQKLALVLFPLNPVLLWVERRLCRERELACDDRVLSATRAPKAYAQCLASLVEHAARNRTLSLALGAWHRQSELAARVQRILCHPRRTLTRAQTAAFSAAILLGLAAGAHILASSPQLLSFTAAGPALTASVGDSQGVAASSTVAASAAPVAKAVLAKTVPAARNAAVVRPATLTRSRHRILRRTSRLLPFVQVSDQGLSGQPRLTITVMRAVPCRAAACPYPPAFVPVTAYAVSTPSGWIFIEL